MSSPERADLDQIERDLPITRADVEVLRRLLHEQRVSFAEALELLSKPNPFSAEPVSRPLANEWEPFRL